MFRSFLSAAALIAACTASSLATAGDINPPSGPVGPTMKPLSDVEPRVAINATNTPGDADSVFRILSPGSYYLTGEILVPPGKRGIEIATDDVTLDLQGFRIGAFAGSLEGIAVVGTIDRNNITVRNGIIRHMQADGIKLTPDSGDCSGCHIESMAISDCDGVGIHAGSASVIRGCTVLNCNGGGIGVRFSNVIENCTADGCGSWGIAAAQNSIIIHCTATNNTFNGITVDYRCTISDCSAKWNGTNGIQAYSDSKIISCISTDNDGNGISDGGDGGLIADCLVSLNAGDGISITNRTMVRGNSLHFNGYASGSGANISASGTDNRIEGNDRTFADFGVRITGAGNFIVRNTCSGNTTNWSIVANNVYGPIINRSAPASPAVTGDSAASALGSTDANANFTY